MANRDDRPAPAAEQKLPDEGDRPRGGGLSRRGVIGAGVIGATLPLTSRAHAQTGVVPEFGAAKSTVLLGAAQRRRAQALALRVEAATVQARFPLPRLVPNGDEQRYPNRVGNYSKGLPHNALGEVDPAAYNLLLTAIARGRQADFEAVPRGGAGRQVSPLAADAFDLEGADSHHLPLLTPPDLAGAELAAETVELYWLALTRDVAFNDYPSHPLIAAAVADLGRLSAYRAPRLDGQLTPAVLFRGNTPGDLVGPYISQLLWLDIPFGATTVVQRYRTAAPGSDQMTSVPTWLAIQNGAPPAAPLAMDPMTRFIRNGRDLGEWDHRDFTYQGFLGAALILLGLGPAALSASNPYLRTTAQAGFVDFGPPHVLDFTARAANAALRAAWFHKWRVHRRLRPEAYGGLVHNHLTGAAVYPIHRELASSDVVNRVFDTHGSFLLPMAYAEGCPFHPSYPAGHATIAGACSTVLKAFFNEGFVFPAPVVAASDGLSLQPWTGAPLTIGAELNKLAANVALGRDTAGVHWRSDGIEGLLLGEEVALRTLRDFRATYAEDFGGFRLTRFDGSAVTI